MLKLNHSLTFSYYRIKDVKLLFNTWNVLVIHTEIKSTSNMESYMT